MSNPVISDNKPLAVTLEKGEKYFWCSCGRSQRQPFCDSSHSVTPFRPLAFTADKHGEAWLCACKHTGKAPFCDGSHKRFSAGEVGQEGPGGAAP